MKLNLQFFLSLLTIIAAFYMQKYVVILQIAISRAVVCTFSEQHTYKF